MTSEFNVRNATGYEQLMGRWSQKLAPLFIDFVGVADGEKILDVGCGTGSLTFALARTAELDEIAAIDYSPVFVDEAIRRNTDPRIKVQQADACALPFEGGTFEMRRVVRPGGVVAAAVWDHLGGMPGMRMIIDTVAALSESGRQLRSRYCSQPMMEPGEMKRTLSEQGLMDVTETELMIRMDYQDFDDYWAPIAAGEGPLGKYVATLDAAERAHRRRSARCLRGWPPRWPEVLCERCVGLPRYRSLTPPLH